MTRKLVAVFGATTIYTILRYVVFGPVDPIHIPVFLLNKSVSMAAVITLFLASLNQMHGCDERCRFWWTASTHCAWLHIVLSLCILSASYYGKFFGDDGRLNFVGELSMLLGGLAAYTYWQANTPKPSPKLLPLLPVLSCLFLAGHLIAMGLKGWIAVGEWHGYMPPISLVCIAFTAASLALFMKSRLRHRTAAAA